MPTDRAACSYQPNDLKSVRRAVAVRFLLDTFLARELIDLGTKRMLLINHLPTIVKQCVEHHQPSAIRRPHSGRTAMKSSVIKRSAVVAGHQTSVSLEDAFWKGLKEIASERDMTVSELVGKIDSERQYANLSSAIRLFVLDFYRDQISEQEKRAGTSEILANAIPLVPKQGQ
jgi:predicted DNA-binding ribbon-helix-helix protein